MPSPTTDHRLHMRLLQYKDLNLRRVKPAFDKVKAAIEAGDFQHPELRVLDPWTAA